MATKTHIYKDNIIHEFNHNGRVSFAYYLYGEDGEINEYFASSLERCKEMIDQAELYNADGEFISE